jgi:hypothetical protein
MRRWGLLVIPALLAAGWIARPSPRPEAGPATMCRSGVELDRVRVDTPGRRELGLVVLRHSDECHATWARFDPAPVPGPILVTITARRPATGTEGTASEAVIVGRAVSGPMLGDGAGCVQVTVQVRAAHGGGEATTRCAGEPGDRDQPR